MQLSAPRSVYPQAESNLKVLESDQDMMLNLLRKRDDLAFRELYQQYSGAIYGNITRRVQDDLRSKFILECTFTEVWDSISTYNETKTRLFTWINQIASKHIHLSNQH